MRNEVRFSRGCAGCAAGIFIAGLLLLATVLVADAQRMPVIEHHRDSANTVQFKVSVPRDSLLFGPWVTIGTHSYQEYAQTMWHVGDSAYETYFTFIYMTGTVTAPERIQGTDFVDQSGIIVQDSILGYIEPGDWIRYLARDFTHKRKFAFRFSYGATLADRRMLVRADSLDGPVIAEWVHTHTGNWNTFEEREIDILEPLTGLHEIFLTFEGDTTAQYHYVMNIDWIELRSE